MPASKARSLLPTVLGWVVVAIILYVAFGFIIGTLRWIIRWVIVLVVVGGLMALYLRLRSDD